MELVVKNIILRDSADNVMGFIELQKRGDITTIKARHNLDGNNIIISVTSNEQTFYSETNDFKINEKIDLTNEIVGLFVQKEENDLQVLASGIINPSGNSMPKIAAITREIADEATNADTPVHQTTAAREIDDILRRACNFDDDGVSACTDCPYREHFYFDTQKEA